MARRDVGNEVVVALAVIGMLALALTFAVVLTLSRSVPPPSMTATAAANNANNTANTAIALAGSGTPVVTRPTSLQATESATLLATQAATAIETAITEATASSTATPSQTATTATMVATAAATDTATNTATLTPTASDTPTDSPMPPSPTDTPTSLPSSTLTLASDTSANVTLTAIPTFNDITPLPGPTATDTPITDAGILPTAIGGSGLVTPFSPLPTACTHPATWVPYTILPNETLFSISLQVGVPLQQLQDANCIVNADAIIAGQVIFIPPGKIISTNTPLTATAGVSNTGNAALCPNPNVRITAPISGSVFSTKFTVMGTASIPNFSYYVIDYRPDIVSDYSSFGRNLTPVTNGVLVVFDPTPPHLPSGGYTMRLRVVDTSGNSPAPCTIHFTLQ